MERTFTFIKPDCTAKNIIGKIVSRYESAGLRVVGMKRLQLSRNQAEGFYAVHRERSFFASLTAFMSEGPVVAMVLEGEGAVDKVRAINGATDPAKAEAGTIRKDFATNIERNAVHASDSAENAKIEMGYIFNALELN